MHPKTAAVVRTGIRVSSRSSQPIPANYFLFPDRKSHCTYVGWRVHADCRLGGSGHGTCSSFQRFQTPAALPYKWARSQASSTHTTADSSSSNILYWQHGYEQHDSVCRGGGPACRSSSRATLTPPRPRRPPPPPRLPPATSTSTARRSGHPWSSSSCTPGWLASS
jgi:hypothetical protein